MQKNIGAKYAQSMDRNLGQRSTCARFKWKEKEFQVIFYEFLFLSVTTNVGQWN